MGNAVKFRFALASLALCAVLTACGASEPNTLFDNAAPEKSMLLIYVSDGEKTTEYRLSNDEVEREILEQLKSTTATPAEVTTEDVKFPIYSFDIGTEDGWGLNMSWSNGYLYNRDGSVYKFGFNWKKLLDKYPFKEGDTSEGRAIGLVERYLVLDGNGWNSDLMREASEPSAPDGILLEAEYDGEKIDAVFRNNGKDEWDFGKYFSLHVRLNGVWYEVPLDPVSNWVTEDIAYIILPGGEKELTYSLVRYGELPSGQYRLFANGLTFEFDAD